MMQRAVLRLLSIFFVGERRPGAATAAAGAGLEWAGRTDAVAVDAAAVVGWTRRWTAWLAWLGVSLRWELQRHVQAAAIGAGQAAAIGAGQATAQGTLYEHHVRRARAGVASVLVSDEPDASRALDGLGAPPLARRVLYACVGGGGVRAAGTQYLVDFLNARLLNLGGDGGAPRRSLTLRELVALMRAAGIAMLDARDADDGVSLGVVLSDLAELTFDDPSAVVGW
jgi:hypothetical protein